MALVHSPRIVTDGIALALDAGNSKKFIAKQNILINLYKINIFKFF